MDLLVVVASPWFYGWLIGLFLSWGILCLLFQRVDYFKAKPISAAHQVVVLAPFTFLAVDGTRLWFFDSEFAAAFKGDKIFGDYGPAISLVIVMLAFQIWDLCTTLAMASSKEVKDQTQHIIHHASTVFLVTLGLTNGKHGFLMYYGAFFFGISEVSSIPLGIMDLFKYSEPLRHAFPAISEASRVLFAILFLAIRCVYWPIVSVDFWIACLASDAALWLQIIWYFFNIALTLLQFYWGSLVVRGIMRKLSGGDTQVRDPSLQQALEVQRSSSDVRVS